MTVQAAPNDMRAAPTDLPALATEPPAAGEIVAATDDPAPFPLSALGPYRTGRRQLSLEDPARDHRPVSITVWYPALPPDNATASPVLPDAEPDFSDAPYPLILSSTKLARIFAPYLVSHGFTWASVDKIDYYMAWNAELVRQPRDLLFALDQVAVNPPAGLEGMIDSEHAGALGYSFDGYNALALSGARIDPQFYLGQCSLAPSIQPTLAHFAVAFFGAQLQGRADLAWYYSPDFVGQYDDLAWGVSGDG